MLDDYHVHRACRESDFDLHRACHGQRGGCGGCDDAVVDVVAAAAAWK